MWRVSCARRARAAKVEAYALYFTVRDPQAPWLAKLLAAAAVGYIFSPIQLIPDWIPVIGCADDLVVLSVALVCIRRLTPPSVVNACRLRAEIAVTEATLAMGHGAVARVAIAVVLALWLLVGAVGAVVVVIVLGGGL